MRDSGGAEERVADRASGGENERHGVKNNLVDKSVNPAPSDWGRNAARKSALPANRKSRFDPQPRGRGHHVGITGISGGDSAESRDSRLAAAVGKDGTAA